jgi:hypothetical protein
MEFSHQREAGELPPRHDTLEEKGWTDALRQKYAELRRATISPGQTEYPAGTEIEQMLKKRVKKDAQGKPVTNEAGKPVTEPRPAYQIPDAARWQEWEQRGTGHVNGWVQTNATKEEKQHARKAASSTEYYHSPKSRANRQTDEYKMRNAAATAKYGQKPESRAYRAAYNSELSAGGTEEEARAAAQAVKHWVEKAWKAKQAVEQASPEDVDTPRQQLEDQLHSDQALLVHAVSSPLAAMALHMQGLTKETLQQRITESKAHLDGIAAGQVARQLQQDGELLEDFTSSPLAAMDLHMQGLTKETLQQRITEAQVRLKELMTPPWLRPARETEDGRASS